MRWIHRLSAELDETVDVVGGKAHGLVVLLRLGLPVPPGFVISAEASRAFLRDGRLPAGLGRELETARAELAAGGRAAVYDDREVGKPLSASVRSGAAVAMPGMMRTVLNVDLSDPRQVEQAVAAVFASWDTPRATTYRELNDIRHDVGTAAIVQMMVFGDHDLHSGAGVAFSRNPNTGEPVPFGEVLFGRQGDAVASGGELTRPLHELADREPAVWARLRDALCRVEEHYRDACYLEFTFEAGELWLLQVRTAQLVGRAAVRVAVDLVDEGGIGRHDALRRVSTRDLEHARTPRIDAVDIFSRGLGACPGVAVGRVATTADRAVRMAAQGPVILVRPETSPLDLHGMAAAAGILTARGGPTCHAAVVARAMGKPAVVGAADLVVSDDAVRASGRTVPEGTLITIDGTGGEVVIGRARIVTASADPHLRRLLEWAEVRLLERTEGASEPEVDRKRRSAR